jgi:type I restriction enzyme S subunit
MCPNGVPFKTLEEVTHLRAGDRVTKSMMVTDGLFPVFGGGTTPTGFLNESNVRDSVTIARAGSAGHVNFVSGGFWATDVCFVASKIADGPDIKFVYYYLKSHQPDLMNKIYGGSMPKLNKKYLFGFPVPLPPLRIQEEIVRLLDTFSELEAALVAELNARRKQSEHYRDSLLNFEELS